MKQQVKASPLELDFIGDDNTWNLEGQPTFSDANQNNSKNLSNFMAKMSQQQQYIPLPEKYSEPDVEAHQARISNK